MEYPERIIEQYARSWELRSTWNFHVELCCPKCKGCAKAYLVGFIDLDWNKQEIDKLIGRLSIPLRATEHSNGKGWRINSFPSEEANSRNLRSSATHNVVLLCEDCHDRSVVDGSYYQSENLYWHVHTRHGVLWANNRTQLQLFRKHIHDSERYFHPDYAKLPAAMVKSSNREEMIKLIDRVLLNGPSR